jgi:tRNA nucleotidyltransferase/poly(A) polymerase
MTALPNLRAPDGFTAALEALTVATPGPVFLVGGSVRDLLLGQPLHDYDLVMAGPVEETARRVAATLGLHYVPLGRAPLMTHRLTLGDFIIDLCPLENGSIEADLGRRDLTINAMAIPLDSLAGTPIVIDPFQGRRDLRQGLVRFVSEENVVADPLRLLRLFRFSAALDFAMDSVSLDLAAKHAPLLATVAGERLREELLKTLESPRAVPRLRAMMDHGLLPAFIPELKPMIGCPQGDHHLLDVMGHTLMALDNLETFLSDGLPEVLSPYGPEIEQFLSTDRTKALLKLAVLLHDLGKPGTRTVASDGRVHFFGHDEAGAVLAGQVAERLHLSTAESRLVTGVIADHMRIFLLQESHQSGRLTSRGLHRFSRHVGEYFWAAVIQALADASAALGPAWEAKGGLAALHDFVGYLIPEVLKQRAVLANSPRLVTGRDIMDQFNLEPSPLIGLILDAIVEAQAAGEVHTRQEALVLARALVNGRGTDITFQPNEAG